MQLVMFSKHLGTLSVREAGEAVRDLGFRGVDLTVRPGGHVTPEEVAAALPEAVRVLGDLGLAVPMITTGITAAEQPHAEAILAAAAASDIRELKLGYWPYRPFGQLQALLDEARQAMDGLEALARKHGVRVSIHSHSGGCLSAAAGNVYLILKDRDPAHAGAFIDPGHMTLEGGGLGWMQGIDLLREYVSMVAVKSLGHFPERQPETGDVRWRDRIVPLREGIVRWREVAGCLKQLGWNGVMTLHSEYQGAHSWRDLTLEELIVQTRDDLAYLLPILTEAGFAP
jgi:sugar phosphate isomerase/epimerase